MDMGEVADERPQEDGVRELVGHDMREWWAAIEQHPYGAPGLVRSLLDGPSVVCDRAEAMQAVASARAHPAWRDHDPALAAVDER
jgi:hypothetical protein